MNSIILPILISGIVCLILIVLLVLNWRRIDAAFGKGGILIYLGLLFFFPAQCFIWQLSLCPPLNNPDAPIISGGGGGSYGLNYNDYLAVTFLLSTFPVASYAMMLILTRSVKLSKNVVTDATRRKIAHFLTILSLPSLSITLLSCCAFFWLEGFNRIWYSDLDRFEGSSWEGLAIIARAYPYLLYVAALFASICLAFKCRRIVNVCTLLISSFPFLTWESRGMSIVAAAGLTGWVLSFRKTKKRIIAALFAFAVLSLIYQIPLVFRSLPGTGISKFGEASRLVLKSDDYSFKSLTIMNLQNISLTFPLFANYYEEKESGFNEMDSLPMKYKLLAFSPTVSFIDGWADKYEDLHLRVNFYTPISTWAELFLINPCLPYTILTIYSVLILFMLRKIVSSTVGQLILSPGVGMLYLISLTMASQYYTRTAMHFMWLSLLFSFILLIINWQMKRRNYKNEQFIYKGSNQRSVANTAI